MWVCLNDSFFSIVSKDCDRHEVLVRARRPGDIEKVFGRRVRVTMLHNADYLYRAVISREEVKAALAREVDRVTYGNFKDSVADRPLHNAYLGVWTEMARLQPTKPYSGFKRPSFDFTPGFQDTPEFADDLYVEQPPPPKPFPKPSKKGRRK